MAVSPRRTCACTGSCSDECFAFEEVRVWSGFVAIGWGHHLYLVNLHSQVVSSLDLGSYFGHLYPAEDYLLVAVQG